MLNNDQVQKLFSFCSRHYVQYYDVQAELVDHLGSAIEEKMAVREGLSFEQALDEVYASFGSQGFSPVVREKVRAVRMRNRREVRRMLRGCFRWPAIVVTVGVFLLQWTSFRMWGAGPLFIGIGLQAILAYAILLVGFLRKRRRQTRSLLANDLVHSQLSVSSLAYMGFLLMQVLNFFNMSVKEHMGPPIVLAVLLDVQCLLFFCVIAAMSRNRERLQEQYPLAFQAE